MSRDFLDNLISEGEKGNVDQKMIAAAMDQIIKKERLRSEKEYIQSRKAFCVSEAPENEILRKIRQDAYLEAFRAFQKNKNPLLKDHLQHEMEIAYQLWQVEYNRK